MIPDYHWLVRALLTHQKGFHPVLPPALQHAHKAVVDLTKHNRFLTANTHLPPTERLQRYIQRVTKAEHTTITLGRYAENRLIYNQEQFTHCQRSLHLGIDIGLSEGTPLFCPLEATVHSVQDNQAPGDYGPTLILAHWLEKRTFYSLYGHLSRESLDQLKPGQHFTPGERIAQVGCMSENGGWPPHLHFQLIIDLQGHVGNYPGVCAPEEAAFYLSNCPDPNLVLQLAELNSEMTLLAHP